MNKPSLSTIPNAFFTALGRLFGNTAVLITGGTLTVQGAGTMQINVAACAGITGGGAFVYNGGNVVPAVGGVNPRYDLIRFASGAAVPSVLAGVAGPAPVPPALPAGDLYLGYVFVPGGAVDYTTGGFLSDETLPRGITISITPPISSGIARNGAPVLALRGANSRYYGWNLRHAQSDEVLFMAVLPPNLYPNLNSASSLTVRVYYVNIGAGAGNVRWMVSEKTSIAATDINTNANVSTQLLTRAALAQDIVDVFVFNDLGQDAVSGVFEFSIQRLGADAADTLLNDIAIVAVELLVQGVL